MPVFVLVSGPFTDGRIWDGTAAALRGSDAAAHPVTLDRRPEAALETQIGDVVRMLDSLGPAGGGVVLVGHDYAIHPVLGAADRRPERIARIVYLDAGLPQDGDRPLDLVPDQTVHQLLGSEGESRPAATSVAAPPPEEWKRWGSTDGLSARQLESLSGISAPQPARTLTEPLRLTGAAAAVPTTGILCTADGGLTIDGVQELLPVGPPRLRRLAEPQVGFFELATGHWPMLSCPEELARVLLRAAAGEGRRLVAPPAGPDSADGVSPYLRPFPIEVSERERERSGSVDLYPPDGPGPHPAVLLVHGGPVAADLVPAPRDWPLLRGYARHLADRGAVGAVVQHRLHSLADYPRAADDVAEAVARLRADPRVDPDRVAVWFFSAGGLLAADWIAGRSDVAPPRCLALNYPVLAPLPGWGAVPPRFRPAEALRGTGRGRTVPPIVLTRVGRESPQIAGTVEEFVRAAGETGAPLEILDVPDGAHGFEGMDRPAPTEIRAAVARSVRSVLARLGS